MGFALNMMAFALNMMAFALNMMAFALNMMGFALTMMGFALKMMGFALTMMGFTLKMMACVRVRSSRRATTVQRAERAVRFAVILSAGIFSHLRLSSNLLIII